MGEIIFSFKLIISLAAFSILPDVAHTGSLVNPASRSVLSNGGVVSAAKSNALSLRTCPTTLFTFQSPYWQTQNTIFTSFIAGRDFVGDVRICRFRRSSGEYIYGFEFFNGSGSRCKSIYGQEATGNPGSPGTVTPVRKKRNVDNPFGENGTIATEFEVLYVTKSVNTDWVTQKNFPKFPNLSPAPLSVNVDSVTTAFLARCRIVVDGNYDPSIVIRIPGVVFSYSNPVQLTVAYNEATYTCDQEDLEFAVCI